MIRNRGPRYQRVSRTNATVTISTGGKNSECWEWLVCVLAISAAVLLPLYFLHIGVFKNSASIDLSPITSLDTVVPSFGLHTWTVSSTAGLTVGQNLSIYSASANVTISGYVVSLTDGTVTVNETYIDGLPSGTIVQQGVSVTASPVTTGPWVFTKVATLPSALNDLVCGASLSLSTVSASPPVVLADGQAYSVVSVGLVNMHNDPVPGVQVQLASNRATGQDMISNPSGVSTSQGVVTFNARSEVVGTARYTAQLVC